MKIYYLIILLISSIFFTLLYLAFRILIVVIANYCWIEKMVAIPLLFAELFVLIHGIGYLFEMLKIARQKQIFEDLLKTKPEVAILIPSYHEPLEIIEKTIATSYNMKYVNKQIVLLDDTRYEKGGLEGYKLDVDKLCKKWNINLFRRKWRGAKAGILNDFINYISKHPRKGSKLISYSDETNFEKIKYIVVFDADQNPFMNFLEPLIAKMEKNKRLAFIQTPQYYTNIEKNRIAKASGMQQAIFYEFISEGKSCSDAMFCCGTNVIYRLEALKDVGGFDESSVTEDFATSFKFHLNNWSTLYYPTVGAFGMGPENLMGYFKQQYRWAFGTISLLKQIIFQFFTNPKQLSFVKWWEYFLSGSYYFIGFVLFIFMICPLLYLFFNIPTYFIDFRINAALFVPYFILALLIYFGTLYKRGYSIKELLLGQILLYQCFLVYMRAAISSLFGKKMKFEITVKGREISVPIYLLWPQIFMGFLCLIGVIWGVNRIFFEEGQNLSLSLNVFWCLYHFVFLSFIFYFNHPKEEQKN